ncbi:interleukin-7 receptor subunit alpha [Anoplopoma fimbria]|uniref:interleukin-7 receptor subunit alpha n=1 Tax=Anoplopoma fimbria TaxID=229290 RepID=UPI0023EDBC20|nr:interleukin-7 receptor subunit alpha [Anoplopoma fimbria]
MLPSCWTAVLLLLSARSRAQSGDGDGDGDGDMEPRVRCTSHILTTGSSLSCKLVGGSNDDEDDEDEEADGVGNMTVCYFDFSQKKAKCLEAFGDTVSSRNLNPILQLNVTVHLKRGGRISTTVDLKKIVQPECPQVKNVTFDEDQAVIRFETPYLNEYIKVDNQLFQLHIWTAGRTITQNVSSEILEINMEHLKKHTKYHVKVRAIPMNGLQGFWSEWSETFNFSTPAAENQPDPFISLSPAEEGTIQTDILIVCLVILVVVPSSVVIFCKNKIFTYMWPRIPHPKHTLVQICKTNKGLLLNFKPEEFSALKVEKTENQSFEETEPPMEAEAADHDNDRSSPACSTQSSDGCMSNTSVSTEESTLLSRSSSDGEDLRLGERPPTPQPEGSSGGNEAEAYVTMSSFYQIK